MATMTVAQSRNRIELAFAKEVDACLLASSERTYSEFARDLRGIERKYVLALHDDPPHALEIRRRVAELTLDAAVLRNCSIRLCKEKLKRNLRLGFTDKWREVHSRLMYAEALLSRQKYKAAMRLTEELLNVISQVEKKGSKYDKKQAKTYKAWISRIRAGASVDTRSRTARISN
jgi:hypothetical protein